MNIPKRLTIFSSWSSFTENSGIPTDNLAFYDNDWSSFDRSDVSSGCLSPKEMRQETGQEGLTGQKVQDKKKKMCFQ